MKLEGSDYMSLQNWWLHYIEAGHTLNVMFKDIIHDIFLMALGNWQSQFVKAKLDEFFIFRGNSEPIMNLDLKQLMTAL